MHPSRIRARISKVWTVSRSARKFCCTIHFSGNLNGSTCSTRIFYGPRGIVRQRGYGPILFSRSASAPSNLYGTKVAMRQSPCTGNQPLAQWRLRTKHLLLHEKPIVDRRLATTVTKSRVEVLKLRPHANDGQHLNVRERKVKRDKKNATEQTPPAKLEKLNRLVEAVCGIYARVARRLGVHRSFVSRVAKGERRSEPVERALMAEYERMDER